MPKHRFTTNEKWNFGIEARTDIGYRTLSYDGSLGGGTLRISTQVEEAAETFLADAKVSAATVDSNGDVVKQVVFRSSGNVFVTLSGATSPDVTVTVL